MNQITYGKYKINGAVIKFPSNVFAEYSGAIDSLLMVAKLCGYQLDYTSKNDTPYIDIEITKPGTIKSYSISFLRDIPNKLFYGLEVITSSNLDEQEEFKKMSSLDKLKHIAKVL
ncbi:hypothetical protein D3C75_187000 [compost metagenome]